MISSVKLILYNAFLEASISCTPMSNVYSYLDRIITIQTYKRFVREKCKPIFPNRSMIYNNSDDVYIQ